MLFRAPQLLRVSVLSQPEHWLLHNLKLYCLQLNEMKEKKYDILMAIPCMHYIITKENGTDLPPIPKITSGLLWDHSPYT